VETLKYDGKTYRIDAEGFVLDGDQWDEDFARAAAASAGIQGPLTEDHWRVIRYIRESFQRMRQCPLLYQTCRANGLSWRQLERLFPAGYQRGACKLAGLTYREGYLPAHAERRGPAATSAGEAEKTYRVDVRGFLVDPVEWDEDFARHRAPDLGLAEGLNERHWEVLRFLRKHHARTRAVPTVYDCCRELNMELEQLEALFPSGYHRGAVKLAGLRAR